MFDNGQIEKVEFNVTGSDNIIFEFVLDLKKILINVAERTNEFINYFVLLDKNNINISLDEKNFNIFGETLFQQYFGNLVFDVPVYYTKEIDLTGVL